MTTTTTTITTTMMNYGFHPICEITKTLQGCIWRVFHKKFNCYAIIKVTNKELSKKNLGIDHRNGKYFNCHENISQEINILHLLNEGPIHPAMIKLYTSFEDEFHIFLVMEDGEYGGCNFLDFINHCHQLIKNGKILLNHWKQISKMIMFQMCDFINWLHNIKHVSHLDISLENLSIQNVSWEYDENTKTYKLQLDTIQIKFIDWGLAELFNEKISSITTAADIDSTDDENSEQSDDECYDEFEQDYCITDEEDINDEISFQCNKFVGKSKYQDPNIFNQLTFDAKKADIWSIGVSWFMICTGYNLWKIPSNNDIMYDLIVNKQQLRNVLNNWNISQYMDNDAQQLFYRIFSDQMYRADATEILKHPWLKM